MQEAKQILVVDDNRDGADSLAAILRQDGHEVRVAYCGISALVIARELKPNVVLLDLAMLGMDGFQVTQSLRQLPETENAQIIAVTGYGLPGDRARSEAAGVNLHLLKPIDRLQLLGILRGKVNVG
jgi:CheY-like chemotaxis protein